jgi:hypothetical protein
MVRVDLVHVDLVHVDLVCVDLVRVDLVCVDLVCVDPDWWDLEDPEGDIVAELDCHVVLSVGRRHTDRRWDRLFGQNTTRVLGLRLEFERT